MPKTTTKEKGLLLLKGFFAAYALQLEYIYSLDPSASDSTLLYIKASVGAVAGASNFPLILLWILASAFLFLPLPAQAEDAPRLKGRALLAGFFSFCILMGKGCSQFLAVTPIFTNLTNLMKFLLGFAGYFFLFDKLIRILFAQVSKARTATTGPLTGFWSTHSFRKAFLILFLAYLPFLLLSYPGNMCWDAEGQIEQVILGTGYNTHHPIVHTLIMGNVIRLGHLITGSYNVGLFLYVLLQTVALAAALAFTVYELAHRKAAPQYLWSLTGFYCISPVFSNITSTAIKDVPFCAAVVVFLVLFVRTLEQELPSTRTWLFLALSQSGVILLRNNGLPMILLTDLGCLVYFLAVRRKKSALKLALYGFGSILLCQLLTITIAGILQAEPGSRKEMLSLPFQQTARYVREYGDELTEKERTAIENVLTDPATIASCYDPKIADPVKQYYRSDAGLSDLAQYFGVWAGCFFKHPGVYFDAFFVHVYGWFDPTVNNAIRYEMDYTDSVFSRPGIFASFGSLLTAYYNFLDEVAPFGMLQNVPLAVWGLFLLAFCERNLQLGGKYRIANLPLWISLLICMASPCFLLHPRYGFPILFTIPYLWCMLLTADTNTES